MFFTQISHLYVLSASSAKFITREHFCVYSSFIFWFNMLPLCYYLLLFLLLFLIYSACMWHNNMHIQIPNNHCQTRHEKAHMRTWTHTYIHTQTHTHIHMHVHTEGRTLTCCSGGHRRAHFQLTWAILTVSDWRSGFGCYGRSGSRDWHPSYC